MGWMIPWTGVRLVALLPALVMSLSDVRCAITACPLPGQNRAGNKTAETNCQHDHHARAFQTGTCCVTELPTAPLTDQDWITVAEGLFIVPDRKGAQAACCQRARRNAPQHVVLHHVSSFYTCFLFHDRRGICECPHPA